MPNLSYEEEKELKKIAVKIRKNVLRMIKAGRAGHVGGALSCTDIMTALYFKIMRVDPHNPKWPERDRFVLSAGHKCLALYGTLAEKGFFKKSLLDTYGAGAPGSSQTWAYPPSRSGRGIWTIGR